MQIPSVILKPSREKSILRRHPWIFSGAVASVQGAPRDGETVLVQDARGQALGLGAYSPHSQIQVRMWTFDPEETIDAGFFRRRFSNALAARQALISPGLTDAMRLVHAESDGLPGLVVDRYGETLVVQMLSHGAEFWKDTLVSLLQELSGTGAIYERSDADVRSLEGLPARVGLLYGEEPPEKVTIHEGRLRFEVDIRGGQKTGFYLDQRPNRLRLSELALDREVLDCFCYTGGFTLAALAGGAVSVQAVDASAGALAIAQRNLALNGFPAEKTAWQEGDVFQVLRLLRDRGQSFDMVVLDPPKFAPTIAQVERAARGYKDINLLALKLLRPGGLLVTFSCSGGVSDELFQKILAGAALDAGVEAQIVERLHPGPDHPVALNFPEGAYLKGLVIRKM
jgi:23S rRNA (cytosine1962-C5)-methyltransferase